MKVKTLAAMALVAMVGLGPVATATESAPARSGEVLVRFAPGVSAADRLSIALDAGATKIKRQFAKRHALLAVPTDAEASVIAALSKNVRVELAERNHIGEAGYTPGDPLFGSQWHLEQNADYDINATAAWDISRGNPAILVAVLDSGILSDQPEFAGRIFTNPNESANGVDDDGNGLVDDISGWDYATQEGNGDPDPYDEHGHGSWVASVFGANTDHQFGIVGLDHFARILPIRVLGADNRGSTADLVAGLYYAVEQGARVINLSLINFPKQDILRDALDYADGAGSILVACAGNGGADTADYQYPGSHPRTISVGATRSNDELASFSSTGQTVDLVAPGEGILAADHQQPYEPDVADSVSGCSLATPIVSGIISLMLSIDPELNRDSALELLKQSAVDLGDPGFDHKFGWGRVDAAAALSLAAEGNNQPGTDEHLIFATGFES